MREGGRQLCMPTQSNQNKKLGNVFFEVPPRQFCRKSRTYDSIKTPTKERQREIGRKERGRHRLNGQMIRKRREN